MLKYVFHLLVLQHHAFQDLEVQDQNLENFQNKL